MWMQFSVGGTVMCGLCLGWEVSVCTHDHTVLLGIVCVVCVCVCVCPYVPMVIRLWCCLD